jgi:DNA-3-methyladenine glycosylase
MPDASLKARPHTPASLGPPRSSVPESTLVPRSFYLRSPDIVAQALLGKLLVRKAALNPEPVPLREDLVGRIVELEAYFGDADPAAHAFSGQTARNAVLYGPPGHAYVYFIYGMYSCLNVSCEPVGRAGSVLIRALEPLTGLSSMAERRGLVRRAGSSANASGYSLSERAALTSGPGRLCEAFGITRALDNGADFTSGRSSLQIREDNFLPGDILATPRIGITKAAERLARYTLADNPFVSGRKIRTQGRGI